MSAAQPVGASTRRLIIYSLLCIIAMLLIYMESNLISGFLPDPTVDDSVLLIGNDQDLIGRDAVNPLPPAHPNDDTDDTLYQGVGEAPLAV